MRAILGSDVLDNMRKGQHSYDAIARYDRMTAEPLRFSHSALNEQPTEARVERSVNVTLQVPRCSL